MARESIRSRDLARRQSIAPQNLSRHLRPSEGTSRFVYLSDARWHELHVERERERKAIGVLQARDALPFRTEWSNLTREKGK
jgi:hypothetical protein